jgi:hypothetical protein
VGEYFGAEVAARYDEDEASDPSVVGRTVEILGQFAREGGAVEFAVGTGRIALPLAARGHGRVGGDAGAPPSRRRDTSAVSERRCSA